MRPPADRVASGEPDTPDRALIEQIAANDEHAFRELLARYRSMVYAVAYAALVDPVRVEAAVTATFGEARRTAAAFLATPGSVATWLTDLARASTGNGNGHPAPAPAPAPHTPPAPPVPPAP